MFLSVDSDLSKLNQQELKNLLGGKGAGLYTMSKAGVNVPPFLVIPTTMWELYKKDPDNTLKIIEGHLDDAFEYFTASFGYMPLLSVRSGARVSLPGMMDTILNVGIDPTSEALWKKNLGDKCYEDSLHRLITMYGSVVCSLPREALEQGSSASAMQMFNRKTGQPFPMTKGQILGSIRAVFDSWSNERAVFYRKMNNIPAEWGTAVVIQAMVFGNLNDNSCTGVMFTRNPDTGEDGLVGEYLVNAQGEDVVAGIRTPLPLKDMLKWNAAIAEEILQVALNLEEAAKDVQDIEFTVQDGKLYILQTRNAKRSAAAAVRIALDLYEEGTLTAKQALKSLTPKLLSAACLPQIEKSFKLTPFATGIPACSGVATGIVVTNRADAVKLAAKGTKVILVTKETTPDDIEGMDASVGVLTLHGGSTSHAAVVARSMNKPCVVGLGDTFAGHCKLKAGDTITIDGSTGRVWNCKVPTTTGDMSYVNSVYKLMMQGQIEIGDCIPTGKPESYVLDLSNHLVDDGLDLMKLVLGTLQEVTGTVYISMAAISQPVLKQYYAQFFDTPVEKVAEKVTLNIAESMIDKPSIDRLVFLGGTVPDPKVKSVPLVATTPTALANHSAPGKVFLIDQPQQSVADKKAIARIVGWLSKDGVDVHLFNSYAENGGGMVARSKVAKELLG